MIAATAAFGILLIAGLTSAQLSGPVTGASGKSCESEGGSCVGIPNGILIPYKGDPTKYISCVDGCGCEMDCTPGTYFNQNIQGCDCKEPPVNSTTTTGPATGPSGTVCESAGGSCKGLPDGKLIAHKLHCDMFISCFLECGCDMHCAEGTYFNETLKACVLPSHSSCAKPTTPPKCPSHGDLCVGKNDGAVIPNEADCSQYIVCVHGCETHMTCPAGLHYNVKAKVCDYPDHAGCKPPAIKTTTEKTPGVTPDPSPCPGCGGSTTTAATPSPPGPSPCPTPSPGEPPSCGGSTTTPSPCECPPPCSVQNPDMTIARDSDQNLDLSQNSCSGMEIGTLLPFPGNCSKFFACGDGSTYIMNCGPGLHFNSKLEACDWPKNAGCDPTYDTHYNPSCQFGGVSCKDENDGKLLPYNGLCSKFIACANGCGFIMSCGQGLHFNKAQEICDLPEYAGCSTN